jgi:predicted Rossmann-fold nucleotide-binding protein
LSQSEVEQLRSSGEGGLYAVLRRCMLAVLNSGSDSDDARELQQRFKNFEIGFIQQDQGLKISLRDAPGGAFVDGKMIRGTRELIFAVLRDLVYWRNDVLDSGRFDLDSGAGITDAVFHISRNAGLLRRDGDLRVAVCWGGHAIGREEYEYSKQVGYEFGLRGLDVCTGCGPGAMKGPMKGATIGHAKQRISNGRYIGITEPGIIAAESPNPIVNSLVIMPDIEKRLEAFIRVGHGVVVFPGGVGTAEEILYLLGILLHPDNKNQPLPMIMTGPASAEPYFQQIDEFVGATLGKEAQDRYSIIIDDPREVARRVRDAMIDVQNFRHEHGDAYYFNWRLVIPTSFQMPFEATHESMSALNIDENLPAHELAAMLRRVFSGIVSGNVREDTIEQIEQQGPFMINGSAKIMGMLDELLTSFVVQKRMKISGGDYQPCYRVS